VPRSPEELIERACQVAGAKAQESLPSDVHFILVVYRAGAGRLFLTWAGSGTPADRRNAIADLHTLLQKK
jgi:hypothetical protein